jgi:hypothetical protein
MTLPNDDNADEIRLQLPCCVGERYGPPLTALDGAAAPSSSTPIRITTDIQTSGRIKSITSPSHADNVSETRYPTHLGRPSRRRSTVQFQSSTFLDRDFILVIRADGLDESRCFAELHRDPEGIRSDTIAMQLTIVPNFQLPPVKGQEYIFLVDRSGSMSGARIETAKRFVYKLETTKIQPMTRLVLWNCCCECCHTRKRSSISSVLGPITTVYGPPVKPTTRTR